MESQGLACHAMLLSANVLHYPGKSVLPFVPYQYRGANRVLGVTHRRSSCSLPPGLKIAELLPDGVCLRARLRNSCLHIKALLPHSTAIPLITVLLQVSHQSPAYQRQDALLT